MDECSLSVIGWAMAIT
jgi:hypothetical protein